MKNMKKSEKTEISKVTKIAKTALPGLAAVIIIAAGIICFMFRHELKTLSTLKEKRAGVYIMTYDGDYGFDEFLETGADSDADIEAFVTKRLLKGLPIARCRLHGICFPK